MPAQAQNFYMQSNYGYSPINPPPSYYSAGMDFMQQYHNHQMGHHPMAPVSSVGVPSAGTVITPTGYANSSQAAAYYNMIQHAAA